MPAVAALAGLLFATSAATAHGSDLRADRGTQLGQLISRQQAGVRTQQQRVQALQQQLAAAGAHPSSPALATAKASIATDRGAAGLTAVTGPGLTVVLNDAPYSPNDPAYAGVPPDYLVVHQQDVQGVVNALWAGGARGVTIMGNRVIATTAVRCVGNTLWLSGQRPYSPPFRITAVGDPAALRAALAAAPSVQIYRQYVEAYHLGYQVTSADRLRLPPYTGSLQLHYAQPVRP